MYLKYFNMTLILQLDVTFFCGSQCFLPPGEDVRGGGGDLHGVLGALPHLLHPLLSLPSYHPQGVDLKCLPGGELSPTKITAIP